MRVNQLKAFYEKNMVLHPPAPSAPIPNPTHQYFSQKSQIGPSPPAPQIPIPEVVQPETQPQSIETQKQVLKNADFINELNKKLMLKSVKPKIVQSQVPEVQPKNYISEPIVPRNLREGIQQPLEQAHKSIVQVDEPQSEELSFDDIMNNAQQKAVFKSSLKARLGINQRNPSTQEEQYIFAEIQKQSSEQIKEKQNIEIAFQCAAKKIKSQYELFKNNKLYTTLYKQEKIKRIDSMLSIIFGQKQKHFISMKPASQSVSNMVQSKQKIPEQKIAQTLISTNIQSNLIGQPNQESKKVQPPIQPRSMFVMSKQMLSEMNIKIKERNGIINTPELLNAQPQRKNERSVSPFNKKKMKFQNFDEA